MSANFLNTSGAGVGIDLHKFIVLGPEGVPVPAPYTPHIVFPMHDETSRDWRIAKTVTTDALPTLQRGWAMLLVVHVPCPPGPPHPLEAPQLTLIIDVSSVQPPLAVHGVTGQGQPLLTETYGFLGFNVDCSDVPTVGASVDINLNSVKTSPTLGDYIGAIIGAHLRVLYAWGPGAVVKWLASTIDDALARLVFQAMAQVSLAIVRNLLNYLASDRVNDAINWITQKVQELVDSQAPLLQ